jgi:serine protease Do
MQRQIKASGSPSMGVSMKCFPRFAFWTFLLGGGLAAHSAWALPGPLDLLRSLSHEFLLHSSQGYLGVDLRDVDPDRAAALKLKNGQGVEIVALDHDAPAAKAGLKAHDVILQMNGEAIDGCEQLRRKLRKQPPGRTVAFVIDRDGTSINVSVQLADRVLLEQQAWSQHFSVPEPGEPEPVSDPVSNAPQITGGESFVSGGSSNGSQFVGSLMPNSLYVGADVNPVRSQLADYFGVTSGTGLLVENVDNQSPAFRAGLRAGDVILKVNSTPMVTRNDWLKAIRNNRGKQVQVTIMRDKQQQTLTMSAGRPRGSG